MTSFGSGGESDPISDTSQAIAELRCQDTNKLDNR
jgi:hypothetical protein